MVTSLLRTKWQRYGRWLYWLNLSAFFIFLIFLTLYALLLPTPNTDQCKICLVSCDCEFEFLYTISPGTGGAETCDGPIINGTIVNGNLTVGVIQNGNIRINDSLVEAGNVVNGSVVVDANMIFIGTVMDGATRMEIHCDC